MACTTILVGKKASFDGSTLVARNEDSPSGQFCAKKFIVVHPNEQPKIYKSVISKVEIPLPENPMRYTCMPNAVDNEGIWGACGVNEVNVSMSATETLTSNERVLGADPLVKYSKAVGKEGDENYIPEKFGGIGEEDMVTLVLPYIKSAREGVIRLGELLEKYGTYEMNGIAFQDVDEIWWLETVGGHHWIARRVPDDCYVIMPNQLGLDNFDLEDAFSDQKEFMCSKDLKEFIEKYFKPESDDIPWCRVPEKKITIEDVKYVLSHHFQGTPYDVYGKHNDKNLKGMYRPIGINRNNFLGLVQIRPYMPESIRSIEWLSLGCNVFNAIVPFYVNIDKTPTYLSDTTDKVTTEDFYWTNRIIGALADAHYNNCSSHIERYQLSVQSKCTEIINKFDEKILKEELSYENATKICELANEKIENELRIQTDDLLDKVLYTASCQMKNGFARSDA